MKIYNVHHIVKHSAWIGSVSRYSPKLTVINVFQMAHVVDESCCKKWIWILASLQSRYRVELLWLYLYRVRDNPELSGNARPCYGIICLFTYAQYTCRAYASPKSCNCYFTIYGVCCYLCWVLISMQSAGIYHYCRFQRLIFVFTIFVQYKFVCMYLIWCWLQWCRVPPSGPAPLWLFYSESGAVYKYWDLLIYLLMQVTRELHTTSLPRPPRPQWNLVGSTTHRHRQVLYLLNLFFVVFE